MGVESGGTGGGTRPPQSKISGGRPPRNYDILEPLFLIITYENFAFFNILRVKWSKSKEKPVFGDRWIGCLLVRLPQTKLRGDALARPMFAV